MSEQDTGSQIASLRDEVTKGIQDLKGLSGNILNVTRRIDSTTNQIVQLQREQTQRIRNVESLNQQILDHQKESDAQAQDQLKEQRAQTLLQQKILEETRIARLAQQAQLLLAEQESAMRARDEALRAKQRTLKQFAFDLEKLYERIIQEPDIVVRTVQLDRFNIMVNEAGFVPDAMEEINDKKYAQQVLQKVDNERERLRNAIGPDDLKDLEAFRQLPQQIDSLKSELESTRFWLADIEPRVAAAEKDAESLKDQAAQEPGRISFYRKALVISFILGVILFLIGSSFPDTTLSVALFFLAAVSMIFAALL